MKKIAGLFLVTTFLGGFTSLAYADGCYICQGKSETYVKFQGEDTNDKRKKAEDCGCHVGGTRSECYAANLTVLCTVSLNQNNSKSNDQVCYLSNNKFSTIEKK